MTEAMAMGTLEIRSSNLELTSFAHGWIRLAPYTWDDEQKVLRRVCRLDSHSVNLQLRQKGEHIKVRWSAAQGLDTAARKQLRRRVEYMLGREICLQEFAALARRLNPAVYRFVRRGGGRLLRGESLFEDAVKTLFTTNASWAFTVKMVSSLMRLCANAGNDSAAVPGFPTADEVLRFSARKLEKECRLGYRAAYLLNVARYFAGREEYQPSQRDAVLADLARIKGLGPYSVNHLSVLLGCYDKMPLDSEVRAFCREQGLKNDRAILKHYSRWAPYQFLGYKCERIVLRTLWIGDD
jgi:N-glycosylase/DNA lyase